MRRFLALGAAALLPLIVAGGAGGSDNQFAVGSAKTELEVIVGFEHASFSAHSTGVGCEAKGQIVYKSPVAAGVTEFTAKIDRLVIDPNLTTTGGRAYFEGVVTKASNPSFVNWIARFTATDSGLPGGQGDTFAFGGFEPPGSTLGCVTPTSGDPITSGNIVIKATGPMLLP